MAIIINSLWPRQNGRHFADDIFNSIFLNENVWTPIKISLKVVPKGLVNNIPALVQIMTWHHPGDKPLSEPVVVNLLTHICVTRPQWVNAFLYQGLGHKLCVTSICQKQCLAGYIISISRWNKYIPSSLVIFSSELFPCCLSMTGVISSLSSGDQSLGSDSI